MKCQPLRRDTDVICPLEILPLNDGNGLFNRLHQVLLSEAPEFCAILYAWGNHENRAIKHVEGHPFSVTPNSFNIFEDRDSLSRHLNSLEYTGPSKPKTSFFSVDLY